jgi:hypothetical protein
MDDRHAGMAPATPPGDYALACLDVKPPLDPLYRASRQVLLDALDALTEHREALVVVGAQAVYLHVEDADLDAAVSPFTTDADFALIPQTLSEEPQLVAAMTAAGFRLKIKAGNNGMEPGSWLRRVNVDGVPRTVEVDLMVPRELAPGHGSRDARVPDHGTGAARWAYGLEAAVIDNTRMAIRSFEPDVDPRDITVRVAGIPALLIAKSHKIFDRIWQDQSKRDGRTARTKSKDAGDVIRLMRGPLGPAVVGHRMKELSGDPVAGTSVRTGVEYLVELFGSPRSSGVNFAAEALEGALTGEEIRVLAPSFVRSMRDAYEG